MSSLRLRNRNFRFILGTTVLGRAETCETLTFPSYTGYVIERFCCTLWAQSFKIIYRIICTTGNDYSRKWHLTLQNILFPRPGSPCVLRPPNCWGFEITPRHTTIGRTSSGRVISPSQRPLPDDAQHLRQTEGLNTAIPASERPHTHTLDRAATGIVFENKRLQILF